MCYYRVRIKCIRTILYHIIFVFFFCLLLPGILLDGFITMGPYLAFLWNDFIIMKKLYDRKKMDLTQTGTYSQHTHEHKLTPMETE